jgi:serine/threonine-protein kinase RsbW
VVDRVATQQLQFGFPGTLAGFESGFARLRSALDLDALSPGVRYKVELVFEEIVANIVRYGAPDGGVVDVRLQLEVDGDSIVLTFDDDGIAFDPRGRPDPPHATSLDDARIGGNGLMLVRRAASTMDYRRTPEDRNVLVVTLAAAPRKSA